MCIIAHMMLLINCWYILVTRTENVIIVVKKKEKEKKNNENEMEKKMEKVLYDTYNSS